MTSSENKVVIDGKVHSARGARPLREGAVIKLGVSRDKNDTPLISFVLERVEPPEVTLAVAAAGAATAMDPHVMLIDVFDNTSLFTLGQWGRRTFGTTKGRWGRRTFGTTKGRVGTFGLTTDPIAATAAAPAPALAADDPTDAGVGAGGLVALFEQYVDSVSALSNGSPDVPLSEDDLLDVALDDVFVPEQRPLHHAESYMPDAPGNVADPSPTMLFGDSINESRAGRPSAVTDQKAFLVRKISRPLAEGFVSVHGSVIRKSPCSINTPSPRATRHHTPPPATRYPRPRRTTGDVSPTVRSTKWTGAMSWRLVVRHWHA